MKSIAQQREVSLAFAYVFRDFFCLFVLICLLLTALIVELIHAY